MATSEQYAAWIVKNKNLKGTPEFEKVAKAYELSKQSQPSVAEAQPNIQNSEGERLTNLPPVNKFLMGAGNAVINPVLGLGQLTGLVPDQYIQERQARFAPLEKESTAYGAGKLGGEIALGAMIPGGATLRGATLGQAALGAAQPAQNLEERGINAAIGGAGGALGYALPAGIGRMLNPQTRQEATNLMAEGVTPTLGQILGGGIGRLEEGATSIPFLGDTIKAAKGRAIKDFNVAAYNRALSPIGESFNPEIKAGHEGIESVYNSLSNAYEDLLPKMKVQKDNIFDSELSNLKSLAAELPEERAKQFNKIIDNSVLSKFTDAGLMHPEQMKSVDSKLGEKIRLYMSSSDADQREMATALQEAQAIMRRMVERQNPEYAKELSNINKGYANLMRIEKAGSMLGAKEGVFSPAQLKNASKAMDTSARKRQTAQGKALLQQFSEEGQNLLGQTVPDSGTPFRLGAMTGLGATYLASPSIPLAILGASGAYTPAGQKLIASALTKRPESIRNLGQYLSRSAPIGARVAAPSLLDLYQQQ